ncbi:hypothetical protein [Bacillus piscicola]|uniref:hypothetical protein n=1 Tax=Bacillus piscicola TaxID=1632684 RepID=UPI001F09991F|nr:hypothetical protein [Bacillus piscicola]
MKKILLLLLLSFCALLLFACQSQEEKMTLIDNVSSISISKSDAYGGLNENYFTTIDEDAIISRFEEIVKNAEGRKQKVDVDKEKPDYDILVRYKNGETHGLHLVLGNTGEKSRIMYIGHELNGFDISPKDTNYLRDMLEGQ